MKIKYLLVILLLLIARIAGSQTLDEIMATAKCYHACRTTQNIHIDGFDKEESWRVADTADHFIQFEPKPLGQASVRTQVRMLYDNTAIYIFAKMFDRPEEIRQELSPRDAVEFAATDYFTCSIDPYNDNQNGYRFIVGASGAQADVRIVNHMSDHSWDAVWESRCRIAEDGWYAEIRIPFYNIRFPKKDEHTFGLQFARSINRLAEIDTWTQLNPQVNGVVNQWGDLEGIRDIRPPVRLQFYPYVAGLFRHQQTNVSSEQHGKPLSSTAISGGLDVKWGINENFTLDATLVPNFGQVVSDSRKLNTSPFELYFQERRPFFTEGTDLFNKGGIFYSRRIGGQPPEYSHVDQELKRNEIIENNPTETQLINAIKFTGRTRNNFGLGILNAVTAPAMAKLRDTLTGNVRFVQTSALTNFNVSVLDQIFPNNSYLSFIQASTLRSGNAPDASVSGLLYQLQDPKNTYRLNLNARMSTMIQNSKTSPGFNADWGISKVNGSWNWSLQQNIVDGRWDPSDLGYVQERNYISNTGSISYNDYKPGKLTLQNSSWLGLNYFQRDVPRTYQNFLIEGGSWAKLKNQWTINSWIKYSPYVNDFYEARENGKLFVMPENWLGGIQTGMDPRKRIRGYAYTAMLVVPSWNEKIVDMGFGPIFRVSSRFNVETNFSVSRTWNARAYNFVQGDGSFGQRQALSRTNNIIFNLNLSPYISLSANLRHYWIKIWYSRFYQLQENGILKEDNGYVKVSDVNQNYFNLDFLLTWQFAPGSFVNLIWKNASDQYGAGISDIRNGRYWDNLQQTLSGPKLNQVTIKVNYFVDYNKVFPHRSIRNL